MEIDEIKAIIVNEKPGYELMLAIDIGKEIFIKIDKMNTSMVGGTSFIINKTSKDIEPILPFEEPYRSNIEKGKILYKSK